MKSSKVVWHIWLVLLLCSGSCAAKDLIVSRVINPPAQLQFEFLSRPPAAKDLLPHQHQILSQPPRQRSVWHFRWQAPFNFAAEPSVLVLGQTMDRPVTLYFPPDYSPQTFNLADASHRSNLPRDAIIVPLPASLKAEDAFWLELNNPRAAPIMIDVRANTKQAQIAAQNVRFYTAMMVLMLACVGISACFYWVLRENIWLLYIVKVLSYFVYMGTRTGEFAAMADALNRPQWIPYFNMTFGNAAAMFGAGVSAFFLVRFIQIDRYAPQLKKPLLIVGTILLCLSPLIFVVPDRLVSLNAGLGNLCLLINSLLCVAACAIGIRCRNRPALFYLIADLPIILTLWFQIGAGMGWNESVEFSNRFFMAAHAFSGLLVSLGLAHQVLGYRQERDEAISTSERDPLTGALNRRAATNALVSTLSTLEKGRGSVCVLFLDLDYFKKVNDSFGHHVGDDALKFLVAEAKTEMRGSDLLARMGGEEFLLVLPGAHLSDGLAIAERIRKRVQSNGAFIQSKPVSLTVSIGVSASTSKLNTPDQLIEAADQALYRAKSRGRNRVEAMDVVEFNRKQAGKS
jgi:diguanylate cyclase (GGDEF)-like protein